MTPKELKFYLQKELLKVRARKGTMFAIDQIGCGYNSFVNFINDRSANGAVSVALKIVCFLINQGTIQLKGGVENE